MTTAHVRTCPYCEHRTPGAESRDEANRRLATHVSSLHGDRLRAARLYADLVATGADPVTARERSNALLLSLTGGPGRYARRPA